MATVGQRVSEYILQNRLGAGTFGEVWLARHHVWSEQLVAIKIPTEPEYICNLQHESAAVHGLVHPNIVRAIGFDPYADPPYLVMEYTPGTSLRPLIQSHALSVADSILIIRQILTGLAHAHRNNIIHRDIKPENILVHERSKTEGYGAEGVIKITDFGLGKAANIVGKQSIAYSLSINDDRARQITGTLNYMSPEQRDGEDVDARADLYACGVVLFEMLTGSRPVGADVPSDLVPAVPKNLDEVFKRSCARLEKRYRTTRLFLNALPNPTTETPEEQNDSSSESPAATTTERATNAQAHVPDSQPIPKPPSRKSRLRVAVGTLAWITFIGVHVWFLGWRLGGSSPAPVSASTPAPQSTSPPPIGTNTTATPKTTSPEPTAVKQGATPRYIDQINRFRGPVINPNQHVQQRKNTESGSISRAIASGLACVFIGVIKAWVANRKKERTKKTSDATGSPYPSEAAQADLRGQSMGAPANWHSRISHPAMAAVACSPTLNNPAMVYNPIQTTTDMTPDGFPPWWQYCSLYSIGYRVGWSWIASLAGAIILVFIVDPNAPSIYLARPGGVGELIGKLVGGFMLCFAFGLIGSYRTWRIARKSDDWAFVGWVAGVVFVLAIIVAGNRI